MNAVRSIPTPLQAAAYARSARRLRAQWKDQPARLHRELRNLPLSTPAIPQVRPVFTPVEMPAETAGVRPGRPAIFAVLVGGAMEGDLLSYSARLRLLAAAAKLGIERFEANLIIAAVQHRARRLPVPRAARSSWPLAYLIAAAVVVQGLVLLIGAWLWNH